MQLKKILITLLTMHSEMKNKTMVIRASRQMGKTHVRHTLPEEEQWHLLWISAIRSGLSSVTKLRLPETSVVKACTQLRTK